MSDFGRLLRTYRRRCQDPKRAGAFTQARLAEELNLVTGKESSSGATISNWERGENQIRRDNRPLLIGLIRVLHRYRGIVTRDEANEFLLAGNYRPLDDGESHEVNPAWKRTTSTQWGELPHPAPEEQEGMLPPPSYTQLFGLDEARDELLARLLSAKAPHLIVIAGIGGIGKTTLADAVARKAIQTGHFVRVVWFSNESLQTDSFTHPTSNSSFRTLIEALGQQLIHEKSQDHNLVRRQAQVRAALKRQRCLIIIDNLEEREEMNWLLAQLNHLAAPSKFLLTARYLPAPELDAFPYVISELPLTDGLDLLRHQVESVGRAELARSTRDQHLAIYRVIGGHPLALRLMARLAQIHPLDQLLQGWQDGQAGYIERTYHSIYGSVWHGLEPTEQHLLQLMPLVSERGATIEQLRAFCELSPRQFWPALTRLVELCLVESRGLLTQKRYGIHSLTRHFIQGQMWQREDLEEDSPLVRGSVANMAYWHHFVQQLTEKQHHHFDSEQPNIFHAVRVTLSLPKAVISPALQENWVALAHHLFPFLEQRGFGHEWLPILEEMVTRFDAEPRPQCQLLNLLGKVHCLYHQLPQAIEAHQQAEQLARHIEDSAELGQAYLNLGTDFYRSRAFDEAVQYAQMALGIFTNLERPGREAAATYNLLGNLAQAQHQYTEAITYLQQAITIWQNLILAPELARTLNNLALAYQGLEQFDAAFECYKNAKAALTQTTSILDRTLIYLSEGTLLFQLNRFADAEATFKKIDRSQLQTSGHVLYQALTSNNLGNTAFMRQDYQTAETLLQESITIWRHIYNEMELANSLSRLGDVYVALGQIDNALACFEELLPIVLQYPNDGRAASLAEDARIQIEVLQHKKKGLIRYLISPKLRKSGSFSRDAG